MEGGREGMHVGGRVQEWRGRARERTRKRREENETKGNMKGMERERKIYIERGRERECKSQWDAV